MGEINQARAYGVAVLPTMVAAGQWEYWRVVEVRHLAPLENRGRHNIFVDAVDAGGDRIHDPALRVGWSWVGRREDEAAPPVALDKPAGEPAGNLDLYFGAHVRIWMIGNGLSSEAVENLHTDHPDEPTPGSNEKFNTRGHHSFYVRFQRAIVGSTGSGSTGSPTDGASSPSDTGESATLQLIGRLQAEVVELRAWRIKVTQFMNEMAGDF